MSQPVPELEKKPSVFPVPAHVGAVLIGGGCGLYHTPENGAVDCESCFPNAQAFIYPTAAEASAEAPAAELASGGAVDLSAFPPVIAGESGPENTQPAKGRTKTQPAE